MRSFVGKGPGLLHAVKLVVEFLIVGGWMLGGGLLLILVAPISFQDGEHYSCRAKDVERKLLEG